MIKTSQLLFFGLVLLCACNGKESEKENDDGQLETVNLRTTKTLKDSIMGKWRLHDKGTLFLEIDEVALKYMESLIIPYHIEGNKIIMSNPDGSTEAAEVKFSGDTLLLRNVDNDIFTKHLRFW